MASCPVSTKLTCNFIMSWADHVFLDLEDAVAQQDGTGGRGANGHIGQALQAEHEKANEEQDAGEPLKSAV